MKATRFLNCCTPFFTIGWCSNVMSPTTPCCPTGTVGGCFSGSWLPETKSVAKLGLTDLTEADVLAFLQRHRASSEVLDWNPELPIGRAAQLSSASSPTANRWPRPNAPRSCASLPNKHVQTGRRELDEDEITAILAQPDRSKVGGSTRSRPVGGTLQYRRPHSGGVEPLSPGSSLGVALPGSTARQRA